MAKQMGPFFITGTLQGITFYKSGNQYLVRMAGGPSKKKIMTSPNFENTRRNISEFTACSKDSTFLRRQLCRYFVLNDNYLYQRITKLFCSLKNYDTVSAYGNRRVHTALKNPMVKKQFINFNFNNIPLNTALKTLPLITTQQHITINTEDIVLPEGANRVSFTAIRLQIDFGARKYAVTEYQTQSINTKSKAQVILKPLAVNGQCSGNVFYFLQIRFYNNTLLLENGKQDCLGCFAIDPATPQKIKINLTNGERLPYNILLPVTQPDNKLFVTTMIKEAPA